jgi:hypothetical protein
MRLSRPGGTAPASGSRYLLPDEHQVITVRRHPSCFLGPVSLVLAVLVVAGLLSRIAHGNSAALGLIWLAWGFVLVRLIWQVADWSVGFFVVTSERLLLIAGLLSRRVEMMPLAKVTDLTLRRPAGGRLFGYGTLIAEAPGQDQALAVLDHIPFPEELYLEVLALWSRTDGHGSIMRSVLCIREVLDPVSPFKIVRLLDQVSGHQDPDSLTAGREQLYRSVADRVHEDEFMQRRPELGRCLEDYRNYSRRRNRLESVRLAAGALAAVITSTVALGYWFWAEHSTAATPLSLNVPLPLFFAAMSVTALLLLLIWLLTHGIHSLDSQLTSADSQVTSAALLEKQIFHEFETTSLELSSELIRASSARHDPMLQSVEAPTLVELESPRVYPSESFKVLIEFLNTHPTSAVGVAGRRGAGKTTLLRWIKYELDPEWIGVYISAPAVYNAADFVRTIFATTARSVMYKRSTVLRQGRLAHFIELFRQPSTDRRIARISQQALDSVTGSRSDQRTTTTGISGKGIALQRGRQAAWTERERSHPELIEAYKEYLEKYRLLEGRRIVIVIDELDKLAKAREAISAVNGLKDLFHIPNTHFVVSVSEDALHRFAMRGIPFRDVFDSAFDTIVKVQPPSPDDGCRMLARRVAGFPILVALFCYAWSGGLPRDMIRAARSCVDIRKRKGEPVSVTDLARQIVRQDVAEAIDDAITKNVEGKRAVGIDGLLSLRHQIMDETISLQTVLNECKLAEAQRVANDTFEDTVILRRLSAYMEIGSTTSEYFSDEISELYTHDSARVIGVAEDLASAKAALAMNPLEAEWFLSRARGKIELPVDE